MDVLTQVMIFLEYHEKEVVILDFHRFVHGFDKKKDDESRIRDRHGQVCSLLKQLFGKFMNGPNSYTFPIKDLIRNNRRILIGKVYWKSRFASAQSQ